jgi:hypothetical protein
MDKLSLLVIQIATIFLPGIIWARLDAAYGVKGKLSDTEFLLRAFIFGIVTYAATFVIFSLLKVPFAIVNLDDHAKGALVTTQIAWEVIWAICVSFVLSILWLYATTYKVLTHFLQWIKATKTYGDEDVWDFTFNSSQAEVEYVHYRDLENKIVYSGWVNTFSETDKLRELVLRDAQVFDFDGNLMFEIPLLYLARKPDNIHLEFPYSVRNKGNRP